MSGIVRVQNHSTLYRNTLEATAALFLFLDRLGLLTCHLKCFIGRENVLKNRCVCVCVCQERKRIAPSQVLNPIVPLDAQTPSLQAHNLLWFQRTQLPRLPKPVPSWLHGFATRRFCLISFSKHTHTNGFTI